MSIPMLFRRKVPVTQDVFATAWLLLSMFLTHVMSQDGQFIIKHVQDPLNDWSSKCVNNVTLAVFLTLQMGQSDAEVLVISGSYGSYPNCVIEYYSDQGSTTIFTFEFPDTRIYNTTLDCDGIDIELYENNNRNETFNVCAGVNETGSFYTSLSSTEPLVSIAISSQTYFQPLKLTATTARRINQGERCDPDTEVECVRQGLLEVLQLCMTVEITCDGHLNCGALNEFDESEKLCSEPTQNILWLMVLLVIIMFAIVSFFLLRCLRRRIPRVGTNFFVFNEDEDNRLNLATVYSQPAGGRGHGVELSSSSYRFISSSVGLSNEERTTKQANPQTKRISISLPYYNSEEEMTSEFPNSSRRKSSLKSSGTETASISDVEPFGNESKKTQFNIRPVAVDVIPVYADETPPKDKAGKTDVAPKSILIRAHDQKLLPETHKKDGEVIEIGKMRRGLQNVISSKGLLNRKKKIRDDEPTTSKCPPQESSSDSD